jgi:hypothetical protein
MVGTSDWSATFAFDALTLPRLESVPHVQLLSKDGWGGDAEGRKSLSEGNAGDTLR